MSNHVTVTASNGVPFTVRVVRKGDPRGFDLKRIYERDKPRIEFYDQRYPHHYEFAGSDEEAVAAGADVLGQYIGDFYLESIRESALNGRGLCLNGGVAAWSIDCDALHRAFTALGLFPSIPLPRKVVVVFDSQNPENLPEVWLPQDLADQFETYPLDRSQQDTGRHDVVEPAEIILLEAHRSAHFPDYVKVP